MLLKTSGDSHRTETVDGCFTFSLALNCRGHRLSPKSNLLCDVFTRGHSQSHGPAAGSVDLQQRGVALVRTQSGRPQTCNPGAGPPLQTCYSFRFMASRLKHNYFTTSQTDCFCSNKQFFYSPLLL